MIEHIIYRLSVLLLLLGVYKKSVMAVALIGVVGSFIMILTVAYTSKKYNDYVYKEQIVDILPIVTGCILMALPMYFIELVGMTKWFTLFFQLVIGFGIFVMFAVITRLEGYVFCLEKIKCFMKRQRNSSK